MNYELYMYEKRKPIVIAVRYSCTTGMPVWLYQGQSKHGMRIAYLKACRKELTRVRWWKNTELSRTQNIQRLLDDCTAALPDIGELTSRQREAIQQLRDIINRGMPCCKEFYNHIRTERTRRKRDQEIRQQMRERENSQNRDYDKQNRQ